MYHFEDTNEDLPYSLYVSSKVKKGPEGPVGGDAALGLGAPQIIMMGKIAIDLAEEPGYILVAPTGRATPAAGMVPRRRRTRPRQGQRRSTCGPGYSERAAPRMRKLLPDAAAKGPGTGAAKGKGFGGFGGGNQPANLRELSENDVMNVIAMVRKEFKVDDKADLHHGPLDGRGWRPYLGFEYPKMFAAVAAGGEDTPAAFPWQTRKDTAADEGREGSCDNRPWRHR